MKSVTFQTLRELPLLLKLDLCIAALTCVSSADKDLVTELQELQMKMEDFEKVKLIGKGAYGEVQLVSCFFFGWGGGGSL